MADAPTIDDVVGAARRLKGRAVVTPLLRSAALDAAAKGRLLIKAEPLQRTGSFKFRGAYNKISKLSRARRAQGVVAWSSGNHAQGVAAAANLLGIPATIVMPADAPLAKVDGTRGWGAEIISYDRHTEIREDIGRRVAEERGATIVPPYDDAEIIAGQGTTGLEAYAQAMAMAAPPDAALVCCGGGGLIAGCATALTHHAPGIEIHAVEPEGFDDTARSLVAGQRQQNSPDARSICDALLAPTPGELTFSINQRLLASGLVVNESQVWTAMYAAYQHLKIVVEPGGAVALAAALSGVFDCRDRTVIVVLSGGNVDPAVFCRAFDHAPLRST